MKPALIAGAINALNAQGAYFRCLYLKKKQKDPSAKYTTTAGIVTRNDFASDVRNFVMRIY